jgi:regulator of cell morphogenesis and NO signaling
MKIDSTRTVRELAVEIPGATREFEKVGIDYCCGGGKKLTEACSKANLSLEAVIRSLESAQGIVGAPAAAEDWDSLSELVAHIVHKHHAFTRSEIARLQALLRKVCAVHGQNHPELLEIANLFQAISQELTMHMMKEEQVLFPYILRMEESVVENRPILPAPFGTIENPVRMMMQEHDSAGEILRAIRQASANFTVPPDGCISYRTLYEALAGFEADLHQHIHLENNILFPRALQMEPQVA